MPLGPQQAGQDDDDATAAVIVSQGNQAFRLGTGRPFGVSGPYSQANLGGREPDTLNLCLYNPSHNMSPMLVKCCTVHSERSRRLPRQESIAWKYRSSLVMAAWLSKGMAFWSLPIPVLTPLVLSEDTDFCHSQARPPASPHPPPSILAHLFSRSGMLRFLVA